MIGFIVYMKLSVSYVFPSRFTINKWAAFIITILKAFRAWKVSNR
jgi:hypothetical protein